MARRVVGVLLGLVCAGLVVMLVEGLGHSIFPPPPGMDLANPSSIDLSALPVGALAMVALAWALGPLTGAFVTTLVGRAPGPVPAFVIGVLFLAADITNLIMIPSPAWLWAVGLVVPLPCAWLGFAAARGVIARRTVHATS